ncbi:MAG: hypothetical protein K0R21_714 [Anaerocolumna sp.]|jgi:NADH:ubiquinone oxidoreductase subunit E|nr:hypothetical protein [Anaerocolumna sp.]
MIITICIGSSCHLKGSREIVQKLENLLKLHNLNEKVELVGSFCIGNCKSGVCVKVDNELFSLVPEDTENFFTSEILRRLTYDCYQL